MPAYHRPRAQPSAPPPRRSARLLLVVGLAISGACHRSAPPACRQDVDCPAGFDCVGGACVRRQRMRFGVDAHPLNAERSPTPPDAGQPTNLETTPSTPAIPPPPAVPPPPPDQPRLPMWKERLKNT